MSFKRRRCDDPTSTIGVEINNNPEPCQSIQKGRQPKPITNVKGQENQKMTYNIDPGGTAPNLEQDPLPVIPGLISAREAILVGQHLSAEHFHKKVRFSYIRSNNCCMVNKILLYIFSHDNSM